MTAPRSLADLQPPIRAVERLVTKAGIRAYAGAPLVSHTGQVLGGLCGLDVHAREFDADEILFLQEMAAEVVERLETGRSQAEWA